MVVPVSLGGPSWGSSFSEVFWNVAEESEDPHCSLLGFAEAPVKIAGNTEVLRPHPTKQRQDGAVITQPSPHRLRNRRGPLTSHRSIAHCAASPGRKEAAGQLWDWHPGVCLPTKASKPCDNFLTCLNSFNSHTYHLNEVGAFTTYILQILAQGK